MSCGRLREGRMWSIDEVHTRAHWDSLKWTLDSAQCTMEPWKCTALPIGQSAGGSVALEKEEVAGTSLMGPSVKGN